MIGGRCGGDGWFDAAEGEQREQQERESSGFRGHDRPYLDWLEAPSYRCFVEERRSRIVARAGGAEVIPQRNVPQIDGRRWSRKREYDDEMAKGYAA
jgi:hypothetical protein